MPQTPGAVANGTWSRNTDATNLLLYYIYLLTERGGGRTSCQCRS